MPRKEKALIQNTNKMLAVKIADEKQIYQYKWHSDICIQEKKLYW